MKIRIPTDTEYDKLVNLTGGDDKKMHWDHMASWINDAEGTYNLPWLYRAQRGYGYSHRCHPISATGRYLGSGFRPAIDLNAATLPSDIKEGDKIVVGTLYMDDKPVRVPQFPEFDGDIEIYSLGAKLEMRDALDDTAYQVTGIYTGNGVAVADRVLLVKISYLDIEEASQKGE